MATKGGTREKRGGTHRFRGADRIGPGARSENVTDWIRSLLHRGFPFIFIARDQLGISRGGLSYYVEHPDRMPETIYERLASFKSKSDRNEILSPRAKQAASEQVADVELSDRSERMPAVVLETQDALTALKETIKNHKSPVRGTPIDHLDAADELFGVAEGVYSLLIEEIEQAARKSYELLRPGLWQFAEHLKSHRDSIVTHRSLLTPFVKPRTR